MAEPRRLPRTRRPIPWKVVLAAGLQVARAGKERWDRLSRREQQELVRIVRASRGRLANLTEREKAELRRIVSKASGFGH